MATYEISRFSTWRLQRSSALDPGALTELSNAEVEPTGEIRSRIGVSRINSTQLTDGVFNHVHSHVLHGNTRYVGVGRNVKRGIDPGVDIITGLDSSRRLTFVRMPPSPPANDKSFIYFANGEVAARKKDDGTTTSSWGIDGPTASVINAIQPGIGAGQPATTLIDAFAAAYTAQDGFGSEDAASDPYATSAREFTVPTSQIERFRRTGLTLDLSTQGEEAFVRIMLRVDNRQNLTHVEVALSADTGAFADNFYTTRISALEFLADNSWQEFKIRKSAFTRVKPTGGSTDDWANIDGVQITVGANSKGQVVVSADDARIEADTHPDGVYDYRITLWNDDLKIRSNSRRLADIYSTTDAITAQVTVKRQAITLGRPSDEATWDAQVTHWEIWRRPTLVSGEWFFVDRVTRATTSFTDTLEDIGLGEALLDINHIPPPAKFILGPYDNRVFFLGMENVTTGSGEEESAWAFRWSEAGRPESVPLGNYATAGDPIDTIQGAAIWANNLFIWTKTRVWRVEGTGGAYVAKPTEAHLGTLSPYSIAESPYGIFYRALDGVYLFTGGTAQKISEDVEEIFRIEAFELDGLNILGIDASTAIDSNAVVGGYANGRYWLTYFEGIGGTRRTLVYDVPTRKWHRRFNTDSAGGWFITRFSLEQASGNAPANNLEAGTANGWLMLIDNAAGTTTDGGGTAIPFAAQTKAFDVELKPSELETDIKNLVIDIDTKDQDITVEYNLGEGGAYVSLGTISTSDRDKVVVPIGSPVGLGVIAYRMAVRLTGSLTTDRITLYGIGFNHIPEPERVTDWSTDFSNIGWPGPKYLRELVLEANTFNKAVVVTVEADGVNLAQTFTLQHDGRLTSTFSFNLPEPIATNVRLHFDPPTAADEWKLYFSTWDKLDEPLEVTRIALERNDEGWMGTKLFKTLIPEIDPQGTAVTVRMYVDETVIGTFTTPATSGRDLFPFSLADAMDIERRGHVWFADFSSASTFKLYRTFVEFEQEPIQETFWKSNWNDGGWKGEKLYTELVIDCDPLGAAVTIDVLIDYVSIGTFTTPADTGRTRYFFSLATLAALQRRGRYESITLSGAGFLYYGHTATFEQEPVRNTFFKTAIQDDGWPGEKRYRAVSIDIDTHGAAVTVTPYVDNVALAGLVNNTFTTTSGREQVHISLEDARGRNISFVFDAQTATEFGLYDFSVDFEREPITNTFYFTQWSNDNWDGEKLYRTLILDIDTQGADVTLSAMVDGSTVAPSPGSLATINTTERQTLHISFPEVRGRQSSIFLESVGTTRFRFYGHTWDFEQEPVASTFYFTQRSHDGWEAEKLYRTLMLDINTKGANVTLTTLIDGVAATPTPAADVTINTPARRVVHISYAEIRGRISHITLQSAATTEFLFYGHQWDYEKEPVTSAFYFTQRSNDGWDGEKLYRTLVLDINTNGQNVALTAFINGTAATPSPASLGTINTPARRVVHVSYPEVRGRISHITLLAQTATRFHFYGHVWDYEKEPITSTFYFTQRSNDGWEGEKLYRTMVLEIDTQGADVTLTTLVNGVAVSPSPASSATINTPARRAVHISYPEVRGRISHIVLQSAGTVEFRFYGHQWDYEKEPITSTFYFTQWGNEGWPGAKIIRQATLEIDTQAEDVTLQFEGDGGVLDTEIANTPGRRSLIYSLLDTATGRPPEARLVRIVAISDATTRFRFYNVQYEFVKQPLDVTIHDTTEIAVFGGKKGWIRRGIFVYEATDTITGTIYVDGQALHTFTLPAQATDQGVAVSFPIGLTGRILRLFLQTAGTMRLWPSSFLETHILDQDKIYEPWRFISE